MTKQCYISTLNEYIFVSQENLTIIFENIVAGTPDLIIEILSPGTAYYDLIEKKSMKDSK
jgi:Uma2 family endonuclease